MKDQAIIEVTLHDAARDRFLNYAVSVITSRALPDVRDGLKPVQRRILYTMARDLNLRPERPPLKCARIVGTVLGSYHPHGDSAVYEALVRMAQDWVLRYPLVEGQGNFGSMDGDAPAAYRYTEARLRALALEFVADIEHDTVDFVPNFDSSTREPAVLPAAFPQLIVNGCQGIAVGVATNIPPHNLREVLDACLGLLDDPKSDPLEHIKGPDLPTGGEILVERDSLRKLYEEGQGSVRIRAEVVPEEAPGKLQRLIIRSIPYLVTKARLVEEIAGHIEAGRISGLINVRDESAEDVRVVLEIHPEAPTRRILNQLYRLTPMETSFHANFTCLGADGSPARMSLREMLLAFLAFRRQVVTRRLTFELNKLRERLHILEGFARVFQALPEALELIRKSDGRADASQKLQARFQLDEPQAEAVLELKLYRIGRRDVASLQAERQELKAQERQLETVLGSPKRIDQWIRMELAEVRKRFGDPRRSRVRAPERAVKEKAANLMVTLSPQGKIARRSGEEEPPADTWLAQTLSEGQVVILFTDRGSAYSVKIEDVPFEPQPVQKLFAFADEERVIAMLTSEERKPDGVYVCSDGTGARFPLESFRLPSGRSGRKFSRSESVLGVQPAAGKELLTLVSRRGWAMMLRVAGLERKLGKGAPVIRLPEDDELIGFSLERMTVYRTRSGKAIKITPRRVPPGAPPVQLIQRGELTLDHG